MWFKIKKGDDVYDEKEKKQGGMAFARGRNDVAVMALGERKRVRAAGGFEFGACRIVFIETRTDSQVTDCRRKQTGRRSGRGGIWSLQAIGLQVGRGKEKEAVDDIDRKERREGAETGCFELGVLLNAGRGPDRGISQKRTLGTAGTTEKERRQQKRENQS